MSIENELLSKISTNYTFKANEYSALALAYIGDAVYEIYARTKVISLGNSSVNKMNEKTVNYVKASAQANAYQSIENLLTEEEIALFKRGRNAKPTSAPKNALLSDYKCATGFEALIGYLYISHQLERLDYILDKALNTL